MSGPFVWRDKNDCDADVVALLTCAVLDDYDAGANILESLDQGQLFVLCWVLARWWQWAWKAGHDGDALASLRATGLKIGSERR